MEPSSLSSHQPHSSFFFFPNYESHFPADGSPGATNKPLESIRNPLNDYHARLIQPVPFFRFRHPSSPVADVTADREAATERILRYLFEATQDFNLNSFSDDFANSPGPSLSAKFANSSSRIPLVTFFKKFWQNV